MAWTQTQLTELEAAIVALATGAQSYTVNGRSVTRAALPELRSLRQEMRAEVGERTVFGQGRVHTDLGSA